jgi:hypothetical protein
MANKKHQMGLLAKTKWAVTALALAGGLLVGGTLAGCAGGPTGSAGSAGLSVATSGLSGVTAVTEDDLDVAMGSYSYNGKAYDITIREVIEMTSTLEAAANEDGTYQMPSADNIITYARNQIILRAAEEAGITVSDEEVAEYALEQLGSDDFSMLASQYGLDEEMVKSMISDSAITAKFREEEAGLKIPEAPVAPAEPAEGQESTPTAEYATYIINLAGDAWDAEKGTWADPDGDYAAALASYEITNDSATYEAAQAAYYIAYQNYSVEAQEASELWTSFYNSIFSKGTVEIYTLVS